jgi:hypothetical protein
MYVHASEKDGLLSGWILEDPIDLFLWFRDGALVQAQITADEGLLEWHAPDTIRTGRVRTRYGLLARSETVELDRAVQAERISSLLGAVAMSELAPDVKVFAENLLTRKDLAASAEPLLVLIKEALETRITAHPPRSIHPPR